MENKARGIDQIIQQAMREGAFDNLAGKGKPLDLSENPHLDPEWQLAYHLLKENGFAPAFIERRQLIETDLAAARGDLARSWIWCAQAINEGKEVERVEAEWEKAKRKFEERATKLNKQIATYNLEIPLPNFFRPRIDLTAEINAIQAQQ